MGYAATPLPDANGFYALYRSLKGNATWHFFTSKKRHWQTGGTGAPILTKPDVVQLMLFVQLCWALSDHRPLYFPAFSA